jgi:uncharacterized membrane protein YfcA
MPETSTIAVAMAATLLSAVVRGYSGFGLALVLAPVLSLFLPPHDAIAMIFVLGMTMSVRQMPWMWRDVDWRSLKLLLPIALATTPIGTAILAASSETVLRFGLSLTVLLVAVLFLLGFRIPGRAGPGTAAATGAVAGVMNGVAAMAGPPMVFFYLSRGDIAIGRATIVAFFGITDGAALIAASSQGLITTSAMVHAAAIRSGTLQFHPQKP